MKEQFKNILFEKNILVNEGKEKSEYVLDVLFSLAKLFGIKVVSGENLVEPEMIKYAAGQLGTNVPKPFYTGFPQSVRELSPDKLLFDQLVHYQKTYGFQLWEEPGHSIMESSYERLAFSEECEIKEFSVVPETVAVTKLAEYVENLLSGTRPLSEEQYMFVAEYIETYDYVVKNCASKNTAVRLLTEFRDLDFARFLSMSDVIRVVDEINYYEYENDNLRKLNLRNQDRKFITALINSLFSADKCDIRTCFEKKSYWNGLLHHIHYKPFNDISLQFVELMRGNENLSVYSEFEKAMAENDIKTAAAALKAGKGSAAVLRNLNYLLSRCKNEDDLQFIMDNIGSNNIIVLIQLLMNYGNYSPNSNGRFFKFIRYNKLVIHSETEREIARRHSAISSDMAEKVYAAVYGQLKENLGGRLGKVYIDDNMKNIALPLQEATSSGGYGVLPKGSRIHIKDGKKIRAFTYWEKVSDIDLSVIGIMADGREVEFSWRTMYGKQNKAITYSGDETSGYNGGSEYFDVSLDVFKELYPDIKYLVFCDNIYSGGITFDACLCKAGYMIRDNMDSGEIFEPKTVESSFVINSDSTFAYLFGIDLEKNDFVWLNISRNSRERVAGNTAMDFIADYFKTTSIINVSDFFAMMATEIVDDPVIADVAVTDKNIDVGENTEVIRSCDFEKMIALMNA